MLGRAVMLVVSLTLGTGGSAAGSHPEATLKAAKPAAPAGSALPITGENFEANQKVALVLRGALGEYRLVDVTATEAGTLALPLEIPADARAGRYQLVALADDGDVVARLELTIEPPVVPSMEDQHAGGDVAPMAMTGDAEMMARTDDLPIERSLSGAGWAIIGLLVGLAGGLGLGLLRRPV